MIITCQWAWKPEWPPCGAPARWVLQRGALPWYACGRHLNALCESLTTVEGIQVGLSRLPQVDHPALIPPGLPSTVRGAGNEAHARAAVPMFRFARPS